MSFILILSKYFKRFSCVVFFCPLFQCYLISIYQKIFQVFFFLLLILLSFLSDQKNTLHDCSPFKFVNTVLWTQKPFIQKMSNVHMRRMCVLLLFHGVLYICQVQQIYCALQAFCLLTYTMSDYSMHSECGVLNLQLLYQGCLFFLSIMSMFALYIFSLDSWYIYVFNYYNF